MAETAKIYELFFENCIDLLCVCDTKGCFIKTNTEWQHTLGYTSEEMSGKQFVEFLHPDDVRKTLENPKKPENSSTNFVNRFRHKDGSYRWIEWRSFPVDDLVYSSARDITQRVLAEEALKESEERNRIINLLTSDFVYQVKINNQGEKLISYVSDSFKSVTDLAKEDLKVYDNIKSIYLPEYLSIINELEEKAVRLGELFSADCRCLINGDIGWFNVAVQPVFDKETGKINSYYCALKNITKQKKNLEDLKESQRLLTGIAENVPGIVFQFYVDASGKYGFNYVSESSGYYFGLDNTNLDMFFESFVELIPDEEKNIFLESIKDVVTKRIPWAYEGKFMRKSTGETCFFKAASRPRMLGDKLIYDGIVLDITESRKRDVEYQELSKLHQTILDTITTGLVYAKENKFVWANNAYLKIHKCKLEDVVGKQLAHFYANKEDYERIRLKALEDFANKRAFSKEILTRNKDGTFRWVHFIGNAIHYDKPEEGTVWMVQDITERKNNDEKVKQLAEMHQTILDTVSVGIFNVKNRKVQWGNAAYLKMFGFELDDKLIPPTLKYKNKSDFIKVGNEGYKVLAQGLIYNTKVEVKRNDGVFLWIYLSGKAIDPEKPNDGSIWMAQDITDAVNNEFELKKNEAILKSTIESINDGVLVVDETGKISNYNTRFAEIFEFPEDILNKRDDNLLIEHAKSKQKYPDDFTNKIGEIYTTKEKTEDLLEFVDGRFIERLSFHLHEDSPVDGRVWLFRDITDKKLTEENLRMFKYSIDYAMDAIIWLNKDGGLDYANEQSCRILGYTHDELMKLKLFDFDPYFSKERFDEDWDSYQANSQGGEVHLETLYKRKDGTLVPVEIVSKHIWIGDAELYVAHIRDITERKKQEERLLKNQKMLIDSQRIAKIGSWDLDLTDRSVIWNRATYEIFGYKKFDEPIILETFFQFVHEEDRDFVRNLVEESIKNKKLKDFECKVVRLDNSIINVLIVGEIKLDENGEPVRMYGIVQDISERKQYEAALEKRVLALTRPLGDIKSIELTDLFSIDDLQKIQDSFAKATGVASIITYPDGKPITKPSNFCNLCKIIRATEKGKINCQKADAELGKKNFSGSTIQPCLSGGLWDAGASITLGGVHIANWLIGQVRNEAQDENEMLKYADEIGVDKKIFLKAMQEVNVMSKEHFENISNALYILASELSLKAYQNVQQARFISEQKRAEDEVRRLNKDLEKKVEERTQKLNEVNKDLEAFAYSVSHDLRAPIRHIDGYTRLLYSGIESPSDTVKNYFVKVKGAIVHMSQMIDDLLSFSRLGRKEIHLRNIDMKKLVEEIILQYDNLPEKYNINWIVADLPTVKGDSNMIRLAFDNLISNAVKYSSKNNKIIIEIGAIDLNDKIEFFVKDNGVGFDMNYVDKLFGVFQRLHKVDEFEGVGIGLANVKQIIIKHNGTVRAESEVNKGATFYVMLPK